jgi:hypothetical protein
VLLSLWLPIFVGTFCHLLQGRGEGINTLLAGIIQGVTLWTYQGYNNEVIETGLEHIIMEHL